MIKRLGQGWKGTRTIAWTLAYALLLQLVLTSAFATSRSLEASPDLYQFCANDPSSPHDSGTDDGTKAFSHCPLCLSRVDVGILPTPPAIPLVERAAAEVSFPAPHSLALVPAEGRVAHRPRGPPTAA